MKKFDIYQIITIILSIAVVVSIGFFLYNLTQGKFGKSALKLEVQHGDASVIVNGEAKGDTPVYTEDVSSGELKVEVNGLQNSYSTLITPAIGTLAVISRDLGINDVFSSGLNIWFDKTQGEEAYISVISPNVQDVSVIVDGVEMGKAPIKFSTKELLNQNDEGQYKMIFKKDGYELIDTAFKVKPGYTLNIKTDLFPEPFPLNLNEIQGLPEGLTLINFSSATNPAFSDKQAWAKSINYWLQTRGPEVIGNFEADNFAYFIDDEGKIYNNNGNEIKPEESKLEDGMFVAYLSLTSTDKLSDPAVTAVSKMTGTTISVPGKTMVKILPTGIGFLRVRKGPSTTEEEVGRVDVGQMFEVLEEKTDWYRIKFGDNKEGWISGTYAEKVEPTAPAPVEAEEKSE